MGRVPEHDCYRRSRAVPRPEPPRVEADLRRRSALLVISSITLGVTLLVLFAGLLHAAWNAIAKSFHDQWLSFTLLNIGTFVVSVIGFPLTGLPRSACYRYIALSVLCHILYQLALMAAYRRGALSLSYPVARGVAPLLATMGGIAFANERLGASTLVGVAIIVGGIVSLSMLHRDEASRGAVVWALLTGVTIAAYTLVDGLGVRASGSPARYAFVLFAVQSAVFLVGACVRRTPMKRPDAAHVALGVGGGVISMVAYGIVLWAQARAPIGVVSALRETGVVWAAVFGVVFFKERGGWRVFAAAVVVAGGVSVLAIA